ncbi:MAG: hypothetical protein SFU86_00015 [Pirellulaceae bacterium]|nr:hypothetical protein [Pirellulaceae bacterium]
METTLPAAAEPTATAGEAGNVGGGIAAQLEAQHVGTPAPGGIPPKRGRPIKHGLYSQAMGSDGKRAVRPPGPADGRPAKPVARPEPVAVDEVAAGAQPRVELPPDLLSKVVKDAIDFGEKFALNKIETAGKRAGLEERDIEPQLQQAQLGETRKETLANLAPYIAEEWGLDMNMSPTVAAVVLLAPWGVASVSAFKTLERLAEERARQSRKDNEHG